MAAISLPALDDYSGLMPRIEDWERGQAEFLAELMYTLLRPQKILDLGCGPGTYLRPFAEHGCTVWGVDGEPTGGGDIPGRFAVADLRLDYAAPDRPYDLCLCIEVGEHLQPEYADVIVRNCTNNARVVFWSAAHPDQGQGTGHDRFHYNEQPPAYWEALFAKHGFQLHPRQNDVQAAILRDPECRKVGWLKTNARVFVRSR